MEQELEAGNKEFWQFRRRSMYMGTPLFKMKLYQGEGLGPGSGLGNNDQLMYFHLPKVRKVVAYTPDLTTLMKSYEFSSDPHAFEIMSIEQPDQSFKPHIVAGSSSGAIMLQPLTPENPQNPEGNQTLPPSETILNAPQTNPLSQTYINDIISLPQIQNRIANCFNNGTIAFWDLKTRQRLASVHNVHSSYTYKLRYIDQKIVSCGHDGVTAVTSLQKMRKMTTLMNAGSNWCSYPVNNNVIAAVGLFDRVNLWDVRLKRLVQSAILENSQSSFITVFDQNNLVLGDGRVLKKCDLRTMQCREFSSQDMFLSAENIIVTQKGGYACGRMCEICLFDSVSQLDPSIQGENNIYHPSQLVQANIPQFLVNDLMNNLNQGNGGEQDDDEYGVDEQEDEEMIEDMDMEIEMEMENEEWEDMPLEGEQGQYYPNPPHLLTEAHQWQPQTQQIQEHQIPQQQQNLEQDQQIPLPQQQYNQLVQQQQQQYQSLPQQQSTPMQQQPLEHDKKPQYQPVSPQSQQQEQQQQ